MASAGTGELRGYDSYRVSLGDEMRGERACLGKSLLDVQRDLRIKAAYIDAIENSEPSRIPYRGFVTGYVRAYARYLGMDEAEVLRRFCAESGFEPGAAAIGPAAAPGARPTPAGDRLDAVIAGSRLAAVSRAEAMSADLGATLRAAASLAVMVALVAGLGYGAMSVVRSIQRVEFAPLPDAPEALAEAPSLSPVTRIVQAGMAPAPVIDESALAAVYAAQEAAPPPPVLRDGPIAALDPDAAGVYAAARGEARAPASAPGAAPAPDAPAVAADAALPAEAPTGDAALAPPAAPTGVAIVADAEAWVRVRDAAGTTLHEKIMQPGEVWRAPEGVTGLTLRAGNAGGVFVEVDGARFGPIGKAGAVVSNIPLDADKVRAAYPPAPPAAPVQSAAALPAN